MAKWNENNQLVRGDEFSLYLTSGKTIIAYATSCSLQVDSETIDTTSKFSCKWQSALGGKASYTISADALYCQGVAGGDGVSFDTLLKYMVEGKQIEWYMGEELPEEITTEMCTEYGWDQSFVGKGWNEEGDKGCEDNPHTLNTAATYYNGKAVVSSVSLEAGSNEIASCSITLTGAGTIQISEKEI